MSKSLNRTFLATLFVVAILLGCRADTTGLETLDLSQLTALLAGDAPANLCDANTVETREKYGVIPGATLLSHYRDYAVNLELPADRGHKLVFYCHSPMCGAAADAARVAVVAGYTDVAIYPDGITGWLDDARPVERPVSARSEKS
jgi:rhodanese-related sulfurtransferase